jgi:hypothetical protein
LHWDDEIRGAAARQIAEAFDQAAEDLAPLELLRSERRDKP